MYICPNILFSIFQKLPIKMHLFVVNYHFTNLYILQLMLRLKKLHTKFHLFVKIYLLNFCKEVWTDIKK